MDEIKTTSAQNQPNKASKPRLLDKAPECQIKGCVGHIVAVYHGLDIVEMGLIQRLRAKQIGLRIYSGTCWVHQDWGQWRAVKGGLMESGQIPLHSRLVR